MPGPDRIRDVFFDAGNTLLFPRIEEIIQTLASEGYPAAKGQFDAAERLAKQQLDDWLWPQIRARRLPPKADLPYWSHYLAALLDGIGAPEAARAPLRKRIIAGFSDIRLWSRVDPETAGFLQSLRDQGYGLGVISNSNGAIQDQLDHVGLASHFDFVLDSAAVGVEKPHPEIFQMALERAGVEPAEAVFIGDVHSIDMGGAALAGLAGVLMDHIGAYRDLHFPRITALPELAPMLKEWTETELPRVSW